MTIAPVASIAQACRLMQHRIKRLSVLDSARLVGLITRADLVRAVSGWPCRGFKMFIPAARWARAPAPRSVQAEMPKILIRGPWSSPWKKARLERHLAAILGADVVDTAG